MSVHTRSKIFTGQGEISPALFVFLDSEKV
nr:MAG TPA: hypothetical protein [Caudoviricetes sp.]